MSFQIASRRSGRILIRSRFSKTGGKGMVGVAMLQEDWCTVAGIRVRLLVHQGGPRAILCWPGTGLPAEEFWDLGRRTANAGFSIVVVEPPGHGHSGPWPGEWLWQDAARILDAALERLGRPPSLLVGHSLGGTTMLMAHQTLSAVCGIAVLDGGLPLPAPYKSLEAAKTDLADWVRDSTYPDWEAWLRSARADLRHWDEAVERGARAMVRETARGIEPAIDEPTIAAMLWRLSQYRPELLPPTSVPVLLLYGSEHPRETDLLALRRQIPNLRPEGISGAGHEIPWDAPDSVADRVLAFAAGLDWSAAAPDGPGSPDR